MSVSILEAYRIEFARQAGKPVFIDQQTTGISFGQYTQWFDMVPQTKKNVLAAYVKFTWTVPGGGLTAQSNATYLDVLLGQVQVAASARVMPRTQTITRRFQDDVEQITFDTNYGYPRTAIAGNFAAAGTYTGFFYIPIGGQAAAIRLLLPSSTNAYTSGTGLVVNSITVYAIEGDNDTVIAYKENNTPSLGTSIQSIKNYIPDDIAPDVMVFVGDTTAGITQLFLVDQNGQMLVAATDTDAVSNGLLALTPRTGQLENTVTTPGAGSLSRDFAVTLQGAVLKVAQAAFGSATTHDIGVIQYTGSADVPQNTPQVTAAPPAVNQTGVQNAAGKPVVSGGSGLGSARGPPVGSRFFRK